MSASTLRLILSASVAFIFYFGWTYWVNSMASDDSALVLRSAIVQGGFSATVTLGFTFVLEWINRFSHGRSLSLLFIVPVLCKVHSNTRQNLAIQRSFNQAISRCAQFFEGAYLPGTLLAPLLPIAMQTSLVIGINLLNQTPSLWATVAPSIFFTALYGYIYTLTLLSKPVEPASS